MRVFISKLDRKDQAWPQTDTSHWLSSGHVGSIKLVLWFWGVDNVLYISHSRKQVTV